MRIFLALLLLLLPQTTAPPKHRLSLEPMLNDAGGLQKLVILYQYQPRRNHGYQMFFVRGDGSLILQAYPQRPMATTASPTCTNNINVDKVKELVRSVIQNHFSDLPQRSFARTFDGWPMAEDLEIHAISIDDSFEREARVFGVGTYAGKAESLPAGFAAIAEQLNQLKEFTAQTPEKPCHLAPAVNFWK